MAQKIGAFAKHRPIRSAEVPTSSESTTIHSPIADKVLKESGEAISKEREARLVAAHERRMAALQAARASGARPCSTCGRAKG